MSDTVCVQTFGAMIFGFVLFACGSTMEFQARGTERAPSAKAHVEIDDDDGEREVDLEIHDLPSPESLGAEYRRYGVWLIPTNGSAPTRVGTLEYQSDIRYGGVEVLSPFERFELVVCAEPSEPGLLPTEAVVLRHSVP